MILSYTILLVILIVTILLDKADITTFNSKPFYYLITFGFILVTITPLIAGVYTMINSPYGLFSIPHPQGF